MKKTIAFIAISGAAVLIISSCSKKNDASYTVKQLAGTYKLTAAKATVPGFGEVDAYEQMDECEKDDLQILREDSTYEYVDAGTQCQDDNSGSGKFTVVANLLISDPNTDHPDTATIKSFNGTNLVISSKFSYSGLDIPATMTLTKQ